VSTPDPRRPYRRFATFFLATGGVFLIAGLARATFAPDLLQGNPIPAALVLLVVGGGLAWTVRQWPVEVAEGPEDEPVGEESVPTTPEG